MLCSYCYDNRTLPCDACEEIHFDANMTGIYIIPKLSQTDFKEYKSINKPIRKKDAMQLLLGKYSLYPGQPQVLFALSKLGAPTQNELAAHLGIGKASAGVSIRRLETGGFVKRVRDKKDTRCIRLSLTKKGEDYARWCSIDYDMFFTTMLESFSAEERGEALACIKAMEGSLDALRSRLES